MNNRKKIKYNIHDKVIVEKVNNVIKRERNREGINRNKNQITDIKYNEYCKKHNRESEIKTHNTDGGWMNRKLCGTKSQWAWKMEDKRYRDKYKDDKRKEEKIKTHECVILYDEFSGNYDAYEAEIEKTNGEIMVKIINGRRKIYVSCHRVNYYEINERELIEVALKKGVKIYAID